ncbi:hypothetical protein M0804_009531 [Polistes exclamans]|nr:hypothetical protein M0804_009531 [Polistes exclamans]
MIPYFLGTNQLICRLVSRITVDIYPTDTDTSYDNNDYDDDDNDDDDDDHVMIIIVNNEARSNDGIRSRAEKGGEGWLSRGGWLSKGVGWSVRVDAPGWCCVMMGGR